MWYNVIDSPAKRIREELRAQFPTWTVSIPSDTSSTCQLTGTQNVVGRLLNGVSESRVCTKRANACIATGQFVHIEQLDSSLDPIHDEKFTKAVNLAMGPRCKAGMYMNPTTLLCV
jgi:hypothetical protein